MILTLRTASAETIRPSRRENSVACTFTHNRNSANRRPFGNGTGAECTTASYMKQAKTSNEKLGSARHHVALEYIDEGCLPARTGFSVMALIVVGKQG